MPSDTKELNMAVSTGKNFANVYVSEVFEDIDRTVVTIFFEKGGIEYKHFTFVLGKGKTRVTLTELGAGKYNCYAIQFSGEEKVESNISFTISEYDNVDTGLDLEQIVGVLEEIRDAVGER